MRSQVTVAREGSVLTLTRHDRSPGDLRRVGFIAPPLATTGSAQVCLCPPQSLRILWVNAHDQRRGQAGLVLAAVGGGNARHPQAAGDAAAAARDRNVRPELLRAGRLVPTVDGDFLTGATLPARHVCHAHVLVALQVPAHHPAAMSPHCIDHTVSDADSSARA